MVRLFALLLVAPGCVIDLTEPTPLAGPPPGAVVVAPLRHPEGAPPPALLVGVDAALRAHGYRVLPLGVGADALRERSLLQSGEPDPGELFAAGRALDVDTVLLVTVRSFAADGSDPLESADWNLDYRLVATATGDTIWQHQLRGSYRRPAARPLDPTIDPSAEPPPRPFRSAEPEQFRDMGELVRGLHRAAFEHLPRR
jgi:hypothetical protein